MLGAIAGDVIGSVYEGRPIKSATFPLFTLGPTYKRLGELYERRGDRDQAIDWRM